MQVQQQPSEAPCPCPFLALLFILRNGFLASLVRSHRTLLSLHWCPWDPHQLIVTEERRGLMMLDV
eukprot:scaffold278517_cov21-Tisochrysis_lutea.AAC.1